MNILLVSSLPPPNGGIATWTEQYLKDCEKRNTVYTVNTALIGKRVLHRGGKMNVFSEIRRMLGILRKYCSILNSKQVDVIHINSSCSKNGILRDAICVAIARKQHIVFHCHCNIQDQLKDRFAEKLGKYIFKTVDYVLVLNKASFSYINQTSDSRVKMIPNSINMNRIVSGYSTASSIRNIFFVGHVKRGKGIYEIIETARQEEDIQFHIIGPVADEMSKLLTPTNVVFYGGKDHEETLELLKKADVFLFPSYTEGFSMAMLEAMATGLPIIATDVGSNADMIESKGGILITPKSSDAIVEAIESIRPQVIRAEMSEWNLHKVRNVYRNDLIFKSIQEVYNEVCI